jgi:iron(III) transport system permease protein
VAAIVPARSTLPKVAVRRFVPVQLVWAGTGLVLAFMVVVPLGWLVFLSFQDDTTGAFTMQNYVTAFTSADYLRPILRSLELAGAVALVATVVGTLLAWLVARTDLPGRGLLRALSLAAFVTPPFLGATAWIFLAAPNAGWLNGIWRWLFHTDHGPLNVFSMPGAIFVMSLSAIPYTFSFVSSTLELMAAELEDAGNTLGAGPTRVARSITLPLALPAILGGFLLAFLEVLAEFGAPAFLLIPARKLVMTSQMYLFFADYPPRAGLAAAYAMPLLAVTVFLFWLQRRILGRRRFTTVTGKAGARRRIALKKWRWPLAVVAFLPATLAVVAPYGALALVSLSKAWGRGPFAPGNLTLDWYRLVLFENDSTRSAIVNTLMFAAAGALVASVVSTVVAYTTTRKLSPISPLLGFLAMAPFVVPGIVLATGFLAAYSHPPIMLYGTAGILIAAYATRFLPIGYQNATSILQGVNVDLENAARTLGAGRLRTLTGITVPLLRRGLLTGGLLVFIPMLRELSSSIFLVTPTTQVISTQIYDYSDAGHYETVSAMGILMMVITFAIVVVAYRLLGREGAERTGGAK